MGAWGIKTFENDTSLDWLFDLEESTDLSTVELALSEADADYIEASEGCNILAVAEIILALQDKARPGLPEEAEKWVLENKNLDATHLNIKAAEAVDKILSKASELNELWQEAEEDYQAWVEDVTQIKMALLSS